MKSKVFTFALLSIFLVSLVAATITVTIPTSVDLSDSKLSKVFTIANSDITDSVDVKLLDGPIEISDGFGHTVTVSLNETISNFNIPFSDFGDVNASISSTIDPDFGLGTFTSTHTFNISNSVPESELRDVTFNFENTYCDAGKVGKLRIKDIDFDVTGYSTNDDEWYLLDNVEVDVEVENTDNSNDIDDVTVEWGLYNTRTGDFIIDDDEKDFDLRDDEKDNAVFNFDVDPDEFDTDDGENDFIFYVKAYSDKEGETVQCDSEATTIKMVLNQNFVILDKVEMQETARPGDAIQVSADVWNIGDDDEEEVTVRISNSALGLNKEIEIGDVDQLEDDSLDFSFNIPSDAASGSYPIRFQVLDDRGDIFENDDNDDSAFSKVLKIEGGVPSDTGPTGAGSVDVTASLDSEATAGEELEVSAAIKNTGSERTEYQVIITNFIDWATLESVEPKTLTLNPGESRDVTITITPNSDAEGSNEFTLQTVFNGKVDEQRISVPLESSASPGFSITGAAIGDNFKDNWFIWLIVLLNVVLVILIIVVAVRMARRSQ